MIYYGAKLSDNITETPEGFLICHDVIIARTGIQEYAPSEVPVQSKDGALVQIYRTKDEVLRDATLASFEGKPVTADHPDDLVTPDNWNDLAVGFTANVRSVEDGEEGYIMADMVITNKDAITAVRDGLREVSCGYEATYTDNGDGTGSQRDIIGNHVALVPRGRCGAVCAIKDSHLDNKGETMTIKEKFIDALSKVFDTVEVQGEEPEAKDAEPAAEPISLDDISKKLDMLIEAIGKLAGLESEESNEETTEEVSDDDGEDMTADADTIARAEIIAPNISKDGDVKAKAMDAFSATEEGKAMIASLSGVTGDALFVAVSELLKVKRNATMTRPTGDFQPNQVATAEDLNKKYADFWASKK